MNQPLSVEQFEAGLKILQDRIHAQFEAYYDNAGIPQERREARKLRAEVGPKYIRIVVENHCQDGTVVGGSAYCFIDRANGNILKPAGFKGPAKNFARGNIVAGTFDRCTLWGVH